MPGIIAMENGGQNGVRSNHDREGEANGLAGTGGARDLPQPAIDKGKGLDTKPPAVGLNGTGDGSVQPVKTPGPTGEPPSSDATDRSRMNDLPEEIRHITQGFIPLSTILARLAQVTHDDLQKAIIDAASVKWMPAAVNGNVANGNDLPEDTSEGNRRRKMALLKFAQDAHTKWVKALVMTDWSRKAGTVSKLIDLKAHLDGTRVLFDITQNQLIELKLSLTNAKLPTPDLKTALQVLTTGQAPWVPEPGYIPPPTLTPEELLKWIEELNTLLSLRLNLEDYDKIPRQFKDYTIDSGRVTFKVKGEFEVDLTIADEDFEKQFWFIDFRFDFAPATGKLSEGLMSFLEAHVNDILGKDGLQGCYKFLHEFVLTHKINELKRQAIELVRNSWTGNLKVEPLKRALAIQYWTNRFPPHVPKSWVMVAVENGKKIKTGQPDPKHPSRLVARWYRDNKEVPDVELSLNVESISTEDLLKSAIAKHVEYILSTIHNKLAAAPRFAKRETSLRLHISQTEPLESSLEMQLSGQRSVTLVIEPITGFAAVQPHTRYALQGETRLNHAVEDVTKDGVTILENVRWNFLLDEINRRGRSAGWSTCKNPIGSEDIKQLIRAREGFHPVFFQRQGFDPNWFVMLSMSLAGDEWVLIQMNRGPGAHRPVKASIKLPFTKGQPEMNDAFWDNVTVFTTGMITHVLELEGARDNNVRTLTREGQSKKSLPPQIRIPAIFLGASDLLKASGRLRDSGRPLGRSQGEILPWAASTVELHFKGVRRAEQSQSDSRLGITVDALLRVNSAHRSKFSHLQGRVDRNVLFDRRQQQFIFRMRSTVGQSVQKQLADHILSIDRLVNFLEAIRFARSPIQCKEVKLNRIKFSYQDVVLPGDNQAAKVWTAILDVLKDGTVRLLLEDSNPHLRVLDVLTQMANSNKGLDVMIPYLTDILPVLRALSTAETKWDEVVSDEPTRVEFFTKAADWVSLRYALPGSRKLTIDIRNKERQGETYWYVSRRAGSSLDEEEFDKVLKPVWNSPTGAWRGLSTGATAPVGPGVLALLLAVDEALRAHVTGANANSTTNRPTQVNQTPGQGSGTATQQKSQNQGAQKKPNQGNGKAAAGKKASVVVLD